MFGLEFLFWPALLALPLAGLPILLHLLFRRKSPVVFFSTLLFIRSSVQHTAARKRIQRWLLLTCRALLLLLLIWAISQPARILASGLFAGQSVAAVIVVDTSYSMQLQTDGQTLLQQADATVNQLLRNELAGAQVAMVDSYDAGNKSLYKPAADILTNWVPLKPTPSPQPLAQRIEQAMDLLRQNPADHKWLIVVSDFQQDEFPRPITEDAAIRIAAIDLHPDSPASSGIAHLGIDPAQPIPGVRSDIAVDVTGHAGTTVALSVNLAAPDGKVLWQQNDVIVHCDENGTSSIRLPVSIPAQPWLMLTASLNGEDAMPWDNQRTLIIGTASRQRVTVIGNPTDRATAITRLALDPFAGRDTAWPFEVSIAPALTGSESAATAVIQSWPDAATARQWKQFASSGHRLILFIRPGLEASWDQLDSSTQSALLDLLPSQPFSPPGEDQAYVGGIGASVAGSDQSRWLNESASLEQLTLTRMMGFAINTPSAHELIRANPRRPRGSIRPLPFLVDRPIGKGHVYIIASLPDMLMGNLPEHPAFVQFMVMLSLPAWSPAAAANVPVGNTLTLPAPAPAGRPALEIASPDHTMFLVKPQDNSGNAEYTFGPVILPGVYSWRVQGQHDPMAWSSVQLPGNQSHLVYRQTQEVLPAQAVVARSMDQLQAQFQQISQPQPHWSGAIAAVLMLLCFEALMSANVRPWPSIPFLGRLARSR